MAMIRERFKRKPRKADSIDVPHRDGQARSSDEVLVMRMEQRGLATRLQLICQPIVGRSD